MKKLKAATLAVGTEITDGQILDRNSAWISTKLSDCGIEVVEHRAVPDDRKKIANALLDLSAEVDYLFVTGGLGPTSDDFTREIISEAFDRELEYDLSSWTKIEKRFADRGLVARPIQKQQCYFPSGAKILNNQLGTANAFQLSVKVANGEVEVFAMPGPPVEIASVWKDHLETYFETLVPEGEREELVLLRTIGRGEGDLAEHTERVIQGTGLRVGYRATVPFVELKFWFKSRERAKYAPVFAELEKEFGPWIVARGNEDLVDPILDRVQNGEAILIRDRASRGVLQIRLAERLRDISMGALMPSKGSLVVLGDLLGRSEREVLGSFDREIVLDETWADGRLVGWRISTKNHQGQEHFLDVEPSPIYKIGTERGAKFLTEKMFYWLKTEIL